MNSNAVEPLPSVNVAPTRTGVWNVSHTPLSVDPILRGPPRVHPQRNRHRPRSKGMKRFIPPRTRHASHDRKGGGNRLPPPRTRHAPLSGFEGPLRRVTVGHYAHPTKYHDANVARGIDTMSIHQTDTPAAALAQRAFAASSNDIYRLRRPRVSALSSRSRSSVSRTEQ